LRGPWSISSISKDWKAPEVTQTCPVRRYLVAALDPAYGQALTITVLEPEYNEKLKRFTTIEDWTGCLFLMILHDCCGMMVPD